MFFSSLVSSVRPEHAVHRVTPCSGLTLLVSHLDSAKHGNATPESKRHLIPGAIKFLRTKFSLNGSESELSTNSKLPIDSLNLQNSDSYAIEIVKLITENNLPISFSETLHTFLKKIARSHKSKEVLSYSVDRYNVAKMLGLIGETIKQQLLNKISSTPYSIAVDEGSTITDECYLAVSVRYFSNPDDSLTTTKMLCMLPIGESTTGESLFKLIQQFLFTGDGSQGRKDNFIGIVSDHASNMISTRGAELTNRL